MCLLNIGHFSNINDKLVALDNEILSCLHMLEDLDLDAVNLVKVAKKLRDTRRERRYWRELQILRDNIKPNALKQLQQWDGRRKGRNSKYKEMAKDSLKKLVDGDKYISSR